MIQESVLDYQYELKPSQDSHATKDENVYDNYQQFTHSDDLNDVRMCACLSFLFVNLRRIPCVHLTFLCKYPRLYSMDISIFEMTHFISFPVYYFRRHFSSVGQRYLLWHRHRCCCCRCCWDGYSDCTGPFQQPWSWCILYRERERERQRRRKTVWVTCTHQSRAESQDRSFCCLCTRTIEVVCNSLDTIILLLTRVYTTEKRNERRSSPLIPRGIRVVVVPVCVCVRACVINWYQPGRDWRDLSIIIV